MAQSRHRKGVIFNSVGFLTTVFALRPTHSLPFRWICFDFSLLCHSFDGWQIDRRLKTGLREGRNWLPSHPLGLAWKFEAAHNKDIIIPITANTAKTKRQPQTSVITISCDFCAPDKLSTCVLIPLCSRQSCIFASFVKMCYKTASLLPPLLSKKSSAFSVSLLPEGFFFSFKTRAHSSSLTVALIFRFIENVKLLFSTWGYEGVILHTNTGDKGIKACCSNPHDKRLGNCFRKCDRQLIRCLVELISWLFLATANCFSCLSAVK